MIYKVVGVGVALAATASVSGSAGHGSKEQKTATATTTMKPEKLSVINSETLPGSLLPNFMFLQGSIEGGEVGVNIGGGKGEKIVYMPDDSCGEDIFEGLMEDKRSPQLPYLTQDLWTCDRKQEDMDVWTFENDHLKVTITPQFAGKVYGIFDKKRGKDLLYQNRAHQPANIGALKAWAAGGAEWNYSPGIIGHSAFSETQVYMSRLDTARGPVIRVHEFDRYNGTVWQVDMLLADDAFIVHPRITNPTDTNLRGYWWTCVAIDATPSTRLLTPAQTVAETSRDAMRLANWPKYATSLENASFTGYQGQWPTDNSFLGNHQIGDMFLRIQKDDVADISPYIGHIQEDDDGFVYVHGHPLNGTKFYTWGQSGPGRFMQDFLAGGGKRQGDYAELQTGPAPTQMQTFAIANNSVTEWTEWFKGFHGDDEVLRGEDYPAALKEVHDWMVSEAGMPKSKVQTLEDFFQELGTQEPDEALVQGTPWGAVEELLLGAPLAPGLKFTLPPRGSEQYLEVQPWVELASDGSFSAETLGGTPRSYQTTDRWLAVVEASAKKNGMTWLHALHMGVAYAERGDVEKPTSLFQESIKLGAAQGHMAHNPIAHRCIALLQQSNSAAWTHYQVAWKEVLLLLAESKGFSSSEQAVVLRLGLNLVSEISSFLQQLGQVEVMKTFITSVRGEGAPFIQAYVPDFFITMEIEVLLEGQQYEQAKTMLGDECFPTYAEARDDLMTKWNRAVEGLAWQELGSKEPLTKVQSHRARVQSPVPENIGCQYASEYCLSYW